MTIQILLFGITTDLIGSSSIQMELPEHCSVEIFKKEFTKNYSELATLKSYAVAVNESYAEDSQIIKENDIIAIIPPVSGG